MDDRPDRRGPDRVNWASVAVYYAIACAISWPLFWWRDRHRESWTAWDVPGFVKGWAPAIGPAVGAMIAMAIFRRTHRRTVSIFGTSVVRSLGFVAVPIVAMTAVGVGDDGPHLTGLLSGMVFLVYALGEELGWRGFLQDAVRPLAPAPRYLTIGLLWGAWHFTTFASGGPAEVATRMAMMAAIWVLGSWGIGLAVDKSRSILVAAMLHLTFNLSRALPGSKVFLVLGPSIAAWVVLLNRWKSGPPDAGPIDLTEDGARGSPGA